MNNWLYAWCLAGLTVSSGAAASELAVGAGAAVYEGAQRGVENQSTVLPLVYFEGERLSYMLTTVSYRFTKDGPLQLSLVGSGRFDGYDGSDTEYRIGMQSRHSAFEVGLQAAWNNVQLSLVTDASGAHDGTEVSLEYDYGIELGKLKIRLIPGVSWQNSKLADYYYGVRAAEQAALRIDGRIWQRPAYEVADAVSVNLNGLALYNITKRWSVLAGAEVTVVPDEIRSSPLVDRRYQWGVFAGVAFHIL